MAYIKYNEKKYATKEELYEQIDLTTRKIQTCHEIESMAKFASKYQIELKNLKHQLLSLLNEEGNKM